MKKLLIIHVIDSLALGGAEVLMMNTVNLLQEYQHLVVYLSPDEELKAAFKGDVRFVCLHHRGWRTFLRTTSKLKLLIKKERAAVVHSHLFVSTLVCRMATPQNIPLLTTLHSTFSKDAFAQNRLSLWAEKLTLRKRHTIIGVSQFVLDDYFSHIPFRGNRFVLYNFIPDQFFTRTLRNKRGDRHLECIALGNLKAAKNYEYLLQLFGRLDRHKYRLDIWGDGHLQHCLQKSINDHNLPVTLRGKATGIPVLLQQYDLFLQSSTHEGFGLSIIEAMASGIPVLVSDIPVFREITGGHGYFMKLDDPHSAVRQIESLQQEKQRKLHVENAYNWCLANFSKTAYKNKFVKIFKTVTSQS
jgi:glycosyltransferase involved in cell wall biosynthesis